MRPSTRIHAKFATVLSTTLALACTATGLAADPGGVAYEDGSSAAATGATRNALLGAVVRFRGDARRGTRMALQRLDHRRWATVATAVAGRSGHYLARWRTDHIGVFSLRAVPSSGARVRASSAAEPERVTVYRPATATWFGRGLYGRKTACGQTLSPRLMGVAHRTLPCGTRVSFLFHGRSITVPVVDRGPFGRGVSWDLTTAAADALGFTATGRGTVGAVSLARR